MTNHAATRFARLTALSIILASGLAIAAPPTPPDAPLRGPRVQDREVPGHDAAFGEMQDKRMRAARVPLRLFLASIKELDSEDAPAELRLSAAQSEQLKAIETELRETMRSLARERRTDARGADGETGERPERGARKRAPRPDAAGSPKDAPAGGPDQMSPERERMRRRDRAGDAPAPDMQLSPEQVRRQRLERAMNFEPPAEVEALRVRAWEVLTEPQQEHVRGRIEARMEQIRAEREAKRAQGQDQMQEGDAPDRRERVRERARQMSPEEILRRIEQLPPEQRERAMERFRRFLEEMESADKPAPEMDEVDIPAP